MPSVEHVDDESAPPYRKAPPVVSINLGLSGAQLLAGLATISTAVGGAVTAGFLFLPAKDSELQALKAVVEIVRQQQEASRDAVSRLTTAVDGLSGIVTELKDAPPRTIERYLPAPITRRKAAAP